MEILLKAILFVFAVGAPIPYDQDRATRMYMMSLSAYCGEKAVQNWHCGPCSKGYHATNIKWLKSSNTDMASGYIGTVNQLGAIVIFLKGNTDIQLKKSYSFLSSPTEPFSACDGTCEVNQYMLESYRHLEDSLAVQVKQYVEDYIQEYPQIIIGGFSMGGSIATIAAGRLMKQKYKVTGLFTFGSPRVGNSDFAYWLNSLGIEQTWRVVHLNDIVPHILARKSHKYRHTKLEVFYFKAKGKIAHRECSPHKDEDPTCSVHFWKRKYQPHFQYYSFDFDSIMLTCEAQHSNAVQSEAVEGSAPNQTVEGGSSVSGNGSVGGATGVGDSSANAPIPPTLSSTFPPPSSPQIHHIKKPDDTDD